MPAHRSPLVFLHGLGGGHHAWDRQLPYFSALGHPSHAWDQPGYGHSATVEPYDLEHVALSLKLLIESLGGEPVVLVGTAAERHARSIGANFSVAGAQLAAVPAVNRNFTDT